MSLMEPNRLLPCITGDAIHRKKTGKGPPLGLFVIVICIKALVHVQHKSNIIFIGLLLIAIDNRSLKNFADPAKITRVHIPAPL
jgi:hypothetical protein